MTWRRVILSWAAVYAPCVTGCWLLERHGGGWPFAAGALLIGCAAAAHGWLLVGAHRAGRHAAEDERSEEILRLVERAAVERAMRQ